MNFHDVFVLACLFVGLEAAENWLNHPLYPCVQCLCHARSGCWRRQNCARYSISEQYWRDAGALTVSNEENQDSDAFRRCMANENCIVGTIINYTGRFGDLDCNCDNVFDCKDRLAIHLKGKNCDRPVYGSIYASRFNHCAARIGVQQMFSQEGEPNCEAKVMIY
ncbi:uncharacterized protein LOC130444765 [Diorhabda sublineata]|uniref:uncharacterized protein LOC130444765 n=1 Tax=Diorhabda sublineata TaxID=1163346 RepID=UPI0024E0E4EC|nr:uncharacterized protein LOC130444765 [Diorhabda sublineata]